MMNDESIMPFGKFKGQKMANVPGAYLLWCNQQEWCRGEVKKYIEANLDVIQSEINYRQKQNNPHHNFTK